MVVNTGSASQGAAKPSVPTNSEQPSAPARSPTLPLDSDYDRIPDAQDKCPYERAPPGARLPASEREDATCSRDIGIADSVYFRYRDLKLVPAITRHCLTGGEGLTIRNSTARDQGYASSR